jgi:hypothetical protein
MQFLCFSSQPKKKLPDFCISFLVDGKMSTKRWFKFFNFNISLIQGASWQNHLLLDVIANWI